MIALKIIPARQRTPPAIVVEPVALAVETLEGRDAASRELTLRNGGGGILQYRLEVSEAWLAVAPSNGSSSGEPDIVSVSFDTDALPPGTYEAEITVLDPLASNTPRRIPVVLTVRDSAACTNDTILNGGFEEEGLFGASTNWSTETGGAFQTVNVCPGASVEASSWILTRQIGGQAWDVNARIGIYPTGGVDPSSSTIFWSDWSNSQNAWSPIGLSGVIANGNTVTMFIEHWHRWALRFNFTVLDDVVITAMGGGGASP